MKTCKSCQAPIIWARSKEHQGHPMPFDATPVMDGAWSLEEPEPGRYLALYCGPHNPGNETRYQTHFGTCPQASAHRRPRKKESA